jgi:4-amino-4-deoxy-L-arabinose transferase-like glycosyltransferase
MSATTVEAPAVRRPRDAGPAPGRSIGHGGRWLRGRPDDPRWVRPALIGLLVATGVLYLWDLGASGWANSFYSAAVQAGTKSWKAFFFGSFDSSNFITVDKSPGALWVMELSARLFGVNSWSILVPNALEGVATVGVVYATVRRWFSPGAALLAGATVALTPVAALMFRFNNPDAFLVLLLTLAAYATVRAVEDGRTRWVVLAGALVGFGFLAKMLQAFLVLPAFGVVILLAAPGPLRKRIGQLVWGGVALVAAAGWWVLAVLLTPAADRPYIGGSQNDSLWNLVFGYNGFGRLTGNESGSVGGGGAGGGSPWGPTGLTRLFGSEMGSQISWLLPAALILLGAGLVLRRGASRRDRTRAALVLWGGWLVVSGAAFSLGQGIIHPYYTVALAPAIGAIIGIGTAMLWARRRDFVGRGLLAAVVGLTSVWAWILMQRSPAWMPELRGAVLIGGLAAALGLLAWGSINKWARGAVVGTALVASLAGPAAYTLDTVATPHSGAIPSAGPAVTTGGRFGPGGGPGGLGPGGGRFGAAGSPGSFGATGPTGGGNATNAAPSAGRGSTGGPGGFGATGAGQAGARGGAGGAGGLLNSSHPSAALVGYLETGARGYRWVLATVGANEAAGYQLSTGRAVMAIGGFNGTDPAPTLAEFEKLVVAGQIHYFIGGGGGLGGGPQGAGQSSAASQITTWVEDHFTSTTVAGVTVYNLAVSQTSSITR